MKLAKLNILIKSSVKTRKLSSTFFCIFVILSTVLMLLSIGLILPMTDNVVKIIFQDENLKLILRIIYRTTI